MNLKQKKEYMAPEMEVVEMGYQMNLLEDSPVDFDPDNTKEYGVGTGTGEVG